ncbi:OLC1v1022072C1 [Oldenlandia corymbosa var. corymbosa]|uniref:OLC1v1022072C1 n=1 Tax=Oldenlandia corymbosa var. corymbosa TaxID=529605 RepID=A0AAV1BX31_OLDCO|nr:OLC1v1022072C1 [Oldenlandia corymbosa var. corymbosa]
MASNQGSAETPKILLNSGHEMPALGFGCATFNLPPFDDLISILLHAIQIGYRHFDTAPTYGTTEAALGKAVAKALESGVIKSRDELFITSKLGIADAHPDLVLPAIKKTLETMGLEYLDLYLVHLPVRVKPGADMFNLAEGDVLPFDMHGTWKVMEICSNLGLTKSIGLSNFSCEKISTLLQNSTIPPAIDQVEMNVGWQQRKLVPFCKEKGIHVSAWSPLGAYGNFWGSNAVMENQIMKNIAISKKKPVSQVKFH